MQSALARLQAEATFAAKLQAAYLYRAPPWCVTALDSSMPPFHELLLTRGCSLADSLSLPRLTISLSC